MNIRHLSLLAVSMAACVGAAPAGKPVPTPWVMTGTVRNAAGTPLAGVEVVADNTVYYDMNVVGKTDAQGRYRLELPHEIGTWKPFATVKRAWGAQEFSFIVHPNDASAFQASKGAVRDFVWRIEGEHEGGVLGKNVHVYSDGKVDHDTLEVTLVPDGPLIDGRTGRTLVRKATGSLITDVPVGRYRVSATHAPGGTREALEVQAEGQDSYASSSVATFRETSYGIRMELYARLKP